MPVLTQGDILSTDILQLFNQCLQLVVGSLDAFLNQLVGLNESVEVFQCCLLLSVMLVEHTDNQEVASKIWIGWIRTLFDAIHLIDDYNKRKAKEQQGNRTAYLFTGKALN